MKSPDHTVRAFGGKTCRQFGKYRQHRAARFTDDLIGSAAGKVTHKADRVVNAEYDQVCPAFIGNRKHAIDGIAGFYYVLDIAPFAFKLRN